MSRFQHLKKPFKGFLYGFLPSKYVFLLGISFYIMGFLFAYFEPVKAQSIFNGGFFFGNIEAKIQLPKTITFSYLINQFIYYLGAVSFNIFVNNLFITLLCIFTGIAIVPVILIGLFAFSGSITYLLIAKVGFYKTLLILLGSFHLYFEILAAFLAIKAFIKFYGSFVNAIRIRNPSEFKEKMRNEFIPLIFRIILLLAIAALFEVLWSTWWVYIITDHYVSWYDFYMGVYSCLII